MMNGVQPRGGPPPSPPISVAARSSNGTGLYSSVTSPGAGPPLPGAGRKYPANMIEDQLQEHHRVLKEYLQNAARDSQGYIPHNRARDKLLRLSPIQFQELSTDVYDELLRREDERQGAQPNVPRFLLPKQNFHPKRNQARQKLSTLVTKKFRELSTDVLFELERRFPRFINGDITRSISPSGSTRSSMRGGPSRRPSQGGRNAPPPPIGIPPLPDASPGPYSPAIFDNGGQRKQFQANTIIPNKGTMVEDDDDNSDDDDRLSRRTTNKSIPFSPTERDMNRDLQAQIAEMQQKMEDLESQMRQKETQIREFEQERSKSSDLNSDLEKQLKSAESLNSSLQLEVEKLRLEGGDGPGGSWQARYQDLERELHQHRTVADEVRTEARGHLKEMRQIAQRASDSADRELSLQNRVADLERNVEEWKSKYAHARTQVKSLRSSAMGFQPPSMQHDIGFTSPHGMITSQSITEFQLAIDELLHITRDGQPMQAMQYMRHIVSTVRSVTAEIEAPNPKDTKAMERLNMDEGAKQRAKLKMRVSAAANNLITASKAFASSNGMAPVTLVDAAASHLVAAVVELVKTVGIRTGSSANGGGATAVFDDDDDDDDFL